MRFHQLTDWLQWLQTLHPSSIELGLSRVSLVARRLDLLTPNAQVVTVAGTNGKGSTVAHLNGLLMASVVGQRPARVGCYTSPHLVHFSERIRVDGVSADEQTICDALAQVDEARFHVDGPDLAASEPISLTYFEFTTLAALLIFKQAELDYWVLEVGLGGRLDAVNIVDADVSVITNIDIDHQGWLGDTRECIAIEKAGIARKGRPLVIGDDNPPSTLIDEIARLGAHPIWLADALDTDNALSVHGVQLDSGNSCLWQGVDRRGVRIERRFALSACQHYEGVWSNLSSAVQAYVLLTGQMPSGEQLEHVVAQPVLGRLSSHHYQGQRVVLDVAHNWQSVSHLLHRLKQPDLAKTRKIGIFALLDDKPADKIARAFDGLFDRLLLPVLRDCERAIPAEKLAALCESTCNAGQPKADRNRQTVIIQHGMTVAQALELAVKQALASPKDEAGDVNEACLIVAFGSFYLVGEVYAELQSARSI